jgi:hypothetical protein
MSVGSVISGGVRQAAREAGEGIQKAVVRTPRPKPAVVKDVWIGMSQPGPNVVEFSYKVKRPVPAGVSATGFISTRRDVTVTTADNGFIRNVRVQSGSTNKTGKDLTLFDWKTGGNKAGPQNAIPEELRVVGADLKGWNKTIIDNVMALLGRAR